MLLPSRDIFPPDDVKTPVIRLKVVLLPAPFGPISATISRGFTSNDTLLTATTPPNCFRAFSIVNNGPDGSSGRACASGAAALSGRLCRDRRGNSDISQGQTPV